jgi:hypothetical protein
VNYARVLARLIRYGLGRPVLLPSLFASAWHFRARDWFRRPPFLPLPPADYLSWRLHTAYGEAERLPDANELSRFLRWAGWMRQRGQEVRMWKKIIVLLVIMGFAWSYPPFRAKAMTAMSPAFATLGPVGHRLSEPTRVWKAENDIKFITQQLQLDKTEGKRLPPSAREFEAWLKKRPSAGDHGNDPWGQTYWLTPGTGTITVGSNGPDGKKTTKDDVIKTISF